MISRPYEVSDDEDDEEEDEEEDLSTKPEGIDNIDLDKNWQYPYHKDMRTNCLPTTVNNGKYVKVFGLYKYEPGKEPIPRLASATAALKRKELKKDSCVTKPEIRRFVSWTGRNHTPCDKCSIQVGHEISHVDILGVQIKVLVPNRWRYRIVRQKLKLAGPIPMEDTLAAMSEEEITKDMDYGSSHLKSWIFTPTYKRVLTANLNLVHNMIEPETGESKSYVHVLVVRREEFENYKQKWGSSHVIMELPKEIPEWFSEHGINSTAEAGKIGYARKVIQKFAEHLDLKTIFMLDDNIPTFYRVSTTTKNGEKYIERKEGNVAFEEVPLYTVLKHLESTYTSDAVPPKDNYEPQEQYSEERSRRSYTGPTDNYGIIGIGRRSRFVRRIKSPFRNTHVYKLYLVNIEALKAKNISYKPWEVWEDLHLNNQCDEKKLIVVKYNRFVSENRNMPTWRPEVFEWKNDTALKGSLEKLGEAPGEMESLLRWINDWAPPGRCEVAGFENDDGRIPVAAKNLIKKVKEQRRAKNHFAVINPTGLKQYLHETPSLMDFVKHVLVFPTKACTEKTIGWLKVKDIKENVINPHFESDSDENEIQFRVLTSHNVTEYNPTMIVVYIEGRVKDPSRECYQDPYNLSVPNTTPVNKSHLEPNIEPTDQKEIMLDEPQNLSKSTSTTDPLARNQLLAPDSDVEDDSEPVITLVETALDKTKMDKRDGGAKRAVIDIENTSGDNHAQELNSAEDKTCKEMEVDRQRDEVVLDYHHELHLGENSLEDETFSEEMEVALHDDESVPYDLNPQRSSVDILNTVPNLDPEITDKNGRNGREYLGQSPDRSSPSLLDSAVSYLSMKNNGDLLLTDLEVKHKRTGEVKPLSETIKLQDDEELQIKEESNHKFINKEDIKRLLQTHGYARL